MKTKVLLASVLLFAVLAFLPREASAQVTTILEIQNTTASTLHFDLDGFAWNGGAGDETFLESCPAGNSGCPLDPTQWSWGPPTTILGNTTVFMGVSSSGLFSGTGGTITYNIPGGNDATSVAFWWSDPFLVNEPVGGCGVGICVQATAEITEQLPSGVGQTKPVTGTTVGSFSTAVDFSPWENDGVAWQLNDPAPTVQVASHMSGYAGDSIVIQGTNFSTTGDTQVLFGGAPSPSVTCATSTECTAVVPGALAILIPATSQVTVDVLGETAVVGTFAYLAPGPACTYSTETLFRHTTGTFQVQCTPDALGDAIVIFQLKGDGWEIAYGYPGSSGSPDETIEDAPVETTATFIGCFSVNAQFPYPGDQGCDGTATTLTVEPNVPR